MMNAPNLNLPWAARGIFIRMRSADEVGYDPSHTDGNLTLDELSKLVAIMQARRKARIHGDARAVQHDLHQPWVQNKALVDCGAPVTVTWPIPHRGHTLPVGDAVAMARLMAAAPALLDACRQQRDLIIGISLPAAGRMSQGLQDQLSDVLDEVGRALTLATGEGV